MENSINLDDIPVKKRASSITYEWKKSIGSIITGKYNDISFEFKIINYNPKTQKVQFLYNENVYELSTGSIIKIRLKSFFNVYNRNYLYEVGDKINTNSGLIEILEQTRIDVSTWKEKSYKYKCLKCGNEGVKRECNLKVGKGCTKCGKYTSEVMEGYNDVGTTHPWVMNYLQNPEESKRYKAGSNVKINMKCKDCGNTKMISFNDLINKGFSCQKCGDGFSYPEKVMYSVLEQLKVCFDKEKRFKWCGFPKYNSTKIHRGRYDFVIEDNKLIIEIDGGFHRSNNNMSGQSKEESYYIDKMKDNLAIENGYDVIRISVESYTIEEIKNNILNSKLSKLYDLSVVDWSKCEKYTLTSIMVRACILFNDTNRALEVCRKLSLPKSTILKYLKRGTNIGLCNYNAEEQTLLWSSKCC